MTDRTWEVCVSIDGENVLTIGSDHYCGLPDLDPYKATIRLAARNLLAFVGEENYEDSSWAEGIEFQENEDHGN